jgi:protein-tyrosine phosphatase
VRICFVCSGNICRSPTAEAVFVRLAAGAGLDVEVDSAGTGSWHAGDDMDRRSRAVLEAAGYAVPKHCAKQFTAEDFAERDLVVALDGGHRDVLWWLAAETDDPGAARSKIVLLRSFDPAAPPNDQDVPDPYYGGRSGFTDVLAQIERACAGLVASLQSNQQAARPPL